MKAFGFKLAALVLSMTMAATAALAETPAKDLFGGMKLPSKQRTAPLGFYAKGCLAGGVAIPVDGPAWQVIHLSRNRRWGTPDTIALVERLAREAKAKDGWNGLMIGDISQPRGGPMLSGHASHQIGLDADIWLTPMPAHTMSYDEREVIPRASVLRKDMMRVDDRKWTKSHERLILRAASYPQVERVFVHPAIKKKLCDTVDGRDRSVLNKIRPIYGHHYHFHVRLGCPAGQGCEQQAAPPVDSGCGKEVADWLNKVKPRPEVKPKKPVKVAKPRHMMLRGLPDACAVVLNAPAVANMAVAEYRSGDTIAQPQTPVTAFVAEQRSVADVIAADDDYSLFVPALGSVPFPLVRPSM